MPGGGRHGEHLLLERDAEWRGCGGSEGEMISFLASFSSSLPSPPQVELRAGCSRASSTCAN